jgi:CheY-like chemotaxis protein
MAEQDILRGKRILAVDDEKDVLDLIQEQLVSCEVTTATDFVTAKESMEKKDFDLVILDIMGVSGFDLLDIARQKKLPAVMLTAHAMTPESLQSAIDKGAVSFLPKEELSRLTELIAEILGELALQRMHWPKLRERLGHKFGDLWGDLWKEIKFPADSQIKW